MGGENVLSEPNVGDVATNSIACGIKMPRRADQRE